MANMAHVLKPAFKAFIENNSKLLIAARLAPTELEHVKIYHEFMRPKSGSIIVDLGCGTGECGALLQQIDPSLEVINVVNDDALIQLMDNLGRMCINASFENTNLAAGIADNVMFNESIGHGDIDRAFKEANRLLKDGGVVTIKDFSITDQTKTEIALESWGYIIHQPYTFIETAYKNGFSIDTMLHPEMYMKHWYDLIGKNKAVKDSAAQHDPDTLPLCMVLYRFIKGDLSGKSRDC